MAAWLLGFVFDYVCAVLRLRRVGSCLVWVLWVRFTSWSAPGLRPPLCFACLPCALRKSIYKDCPLG